MHLFMTWDQWIIIRYRLSFPIKFNNIITLTNTSDYSVVQDYK